MRGISEDRLKEYANKLRVSNNPDKLALVALIDILIDECQEPNGWEDALAEEGALAFDAGFAEGFNKGFAQEKELSTLPKEK
jgi:hypothetical protein